MSIQTLVEKIKEKGNPTVAGLDARLEYIPQHISGRNMMLHGETLRAAAEMLFSSATAQKYSSCLIFIARPPCHTFVVWYADKLSTFHYSTSLL